ncbi:MAG TPA: hypothetical protein VLJ58_05235 [Ramlibacter sp.]|nr:hypothetical protein [Ramlibacter sp.]
MSRLFWALSLCLMAAVAPGTAVAADEVEQGLATLWEVLWHQSGTPTRIVRWETDLKVRMTGIDLAQHREYTMKALRTVATEAGVKLIDVSDQPDAAQVANVNVEIKPDSALEDNQPCVTYIDFRTETKIDTATIHMRSRDAWRCAYHEAMHLMGVRGHPAGRTVLSYFPWKVDGLQPLDKVMLRAWYSPRMKGGMTPFEALPVLAAELVATQEDKAAALQAQSRFFAGTVEQMQAYAGGKGDVPAVVKRSGKTTDEGVRMGRTEMSFFLGVAYQEGVTVSADHNQAVYWFERAATAGSRRAQVRLGSMR